MKGSNKFKETLRKAGHSIQQEPIVKKEESNNKEQKIATQCSTLYEKLVNGLREAWEKICEKDKTLTKKNYYQRYNSSKLGYKRGKK